MARRNILGVMGATLFLVQHLNGAKHNLQTLTVTHLYQPILPSTKLRFKTIVSSNPQIHLLTSCAMSLSFP